MSRKQLKKELLKQLKRELSPFCNEFTNKYPTESICLIDEWVGIESTTYTLIIIAPEIPDNKYCNTLSEAVNIYWDNTTPKTRKHIRKIRIETDEDVHYNNIGSDILLYNNTEENLCLHCSQYETII